MMKNFDDPDALNESLKITEEAVEAQVNISRTDTVYQENRALEAEIERLRWQVAELNETIEFLNPPYGILELQDQLDAAEERVAELEKENEKLRTIEIIQEGCHTRVTVGGVEAFPLVIQGPIEEEK